MAKPGPWQCGGSSSFNQPGLQVVRERKPSSNCLKTGKELCSLTNLKSLEEWAALQTRREAWETPSELRPLPSPRLSLAYFFLRLSKARKFLAGSAEAGAPYVHARVPSGATWVSFPSQKQSLWVGRVVVTCSLSLCLGRNIPTLGAQNCGEGSVCPPEQAYLQA